MNGIDHVGINVPDIEAATRFFVEGLDGEVLYDGHARSAQPLAGKELEERHGLAAGAQLLAQRMIKLGTGPDVELFEVRAPEQTEPVRGSDLGLIHLALHTEDIELSAQRFTAAGGTMLSPPMPPGFAAEAGHGNLYCYGLTPWGMSVEFITLPGDMTYEDHTALRRWSRRPQD